MIYQDRLETNRANIKCRAFSCNFCYCFWGQHCCWTCKCEKNDYHGCAFTLNSSKQFRTRGTSKPSAFASPWKSGLRIKIF